MLQVFAHRGFTRKFPENSAPAFRQAILRGVDGIELDVQLTADGECVVLHDSEVDRTSDGTGAVAELNLAQIKQLDAGSWFSEDFADLRFLTLGEALAVVNNAVELNIHLKDTTEDALAACAVAELEKSQALTTAFLAARRPTIIRARALDPLIRCCYLAPHPHNHSNFLIESQLLGCDVVQLPHEHVTKEFVAEAHRLGMRVNALHLESSFRASIAPNKETVRGNLSAYGVDGVNTDYPEFWLRDRE